MKALILAGGRGNRLNEFTKGRNKCMTIIGGRPIIEYSMNNAIGLDIDKLLIVVGYRKEEIIGQYGDTYKGCKIEYIIQENQNGLVHAIECAKKSLNGSDFVLFLGDIFLTKPKYKEMVDSFYANNLFAAVGAVHVENKELIRKTFTMATNDHNDIFRLVEKPTYFFNNLMGTGECVFRNEILNFIKFTQPSIKRNEKELTDLIQCAVDDGEKIKSFLIGDQYINLNTKDDVNRVNHILAK